MGSNADVEAVTGDGTDVTDLDGAFAMPGLIDIHGFHGMSTENRVYCELKGTFWEPTEEQILADLRACAENFPAEPEWFIAEGFTPGPMSKEALSLATLDEIVPDKPAYVQDESGHNAWVNTRALEVARVTAETPDPVAESEKLPLNLLIQRHLICPATKTSSPSHYGSALPLGSSLRNLRALEAL